MSMKITFAGAVVAGAAVLAATPLTPALATEPAGTTARRIAPVSALQPLSVLIGSWNCAGTTTAPDGTRTTFDTTSTAKFILNGNFMRWQETNSIGGTTIASAEYIWGWNAQQQVFTADRFDDSGQRGAQSSPGWSGNVLTSTGDLVQTNGTSLALTTTITKTAKNSFTVRAVVDLGVAAGGATVRSESICTK